MAKKSKPKVKMTDDSSAPLVQRLEHTFNGKVIREPQVTLEDWLDDNGKITTGFRRIDVVELLRKRGSNVTKEHVVAADRYRLDYEQGILGAKINAGGNVEVRAPGFHGVEPPLARLRALRRVRHADQSIGPTLRQMMVKVLIENVTMDEWGELHRMHPRVATGRLVAILDRLCDHYAHLNVKPERKKS